MNIIKKPYGFEAFQASPGRVWIFISLKDPLEKNIISADFIPSVKDNSSLQDLVVFSSGIDHIPVGSKIRLTKDAQNVETLSIQMHPEVVKEMKVRTETAKATKKTEVHLNPSVPLEGFLSIEAYEIDGYQLPQDGGN